MVTVISTPKMEQNELTGHFRTIKKYKQLSKERRRIEKELPPPVFLSLSPETGLSYTPPPPRPKPAKPQYNETYGEWAKSKRQEDRHTYNVAFKLKILSTFDHSRGTFGVPQYFCKHCTGMFVWDMLECMVCGSPNSMLPLVEMHSRDSVFENQKEMQFTCSTCTKKTLYWYPQCFDCGSIMTIKNKDGVVSQLRSLDAYDTFVKAAETKKESITKSYTYCKTCEAIYEKGLQCPSCTETQGVVQFNQPEPPLDPM